MAAKKKPIAKKVAKKAVKKVAPEPTPRVIHTEPPMTVTAPPVVSDSVALEYRKQAGGGEWHFSSLCLNWPNNDYVVRTERPVASICTNCDILTGGHHAGT